MSTKKIREDMEALKTLKRNKEAIEEKDRLRNEITLLRQENSRLRIRNDMQEGLLNEMGHKGFFSPQIRFRIWTEDPPDQELVDEISLKRDVIHHTLLTDILNEYPNLKPELRYEIDKRVNDSVNRILVNPEEWPIMLKQLVQERVDDGTKQRLNQEFYAEVEARVHPEIQRYLNQVWPNFVENWVTRYFQIHLGNQLRTFNIEMELTCDKCGTLTALTVTPDMIAEMLSVRTGRIKFPCVNPGCLDYRRRHMVPVTLGQVVMEVINRTPKDPVYAMPIITAHPLKASELTSNSTEDVGQDKPPQEPENNNGEEKG